MMVILCGISEVERGQQSEYICLKKCYQKFNEKLEGACAQAYPSR